MEKSLFRLVVSDSVAYGHIFSNVEFMVEETMAMDSDCFHLVCKRGVLVILLHETANLPQMQTRRAEQLFTCNAKKVVCSLA